MIAKHVHPEPADEQALKEVKEQIEQMRAKEKAWREKSKQQNIAMWEAGGVLPKDVTAALDCSCSCHPKLAELHASGMDCSCQPKSELQQQQLAEKRRKALQELQQLWSEGPDHYKLVEQTAHELGVDAKLHLIACPLVITGVYNNRHFYLRERHGMYRIVTAVDEQTDPWADVHADYILLKEGTDSDFDTPEEALKLAVDTLQTYYNMQTCTHKDAKKYCPDCGKQTN